MLAPFKSITETTADEFHSKRRSIFSQLINLGCFHKSTLIRLFVYQLLIVVLNLMLPILMKYIIDNGLQKNDVELTFIYSSLSILTAYAGYRAYLIYFNSTTDLSHQLILKLKKLLFNRISSMSMNFFSTTKSGAISNALINDMKIIEISIASRFPTLIVQSLDMILCIAVMFIIDFRLSLLIFSLSPFLIITCISTFTTESNLREKVHDQQSEVNSIIQENLSVSGALLSKTIGTPDFISQKYEQSCENISKMELKSAETSNVFFIGFNATVSWIIPSLLYCGAALVFLYGSAVIPLGTLLAFATIQTRACHLILSVIGLLFDINKSTASFRNVFDFLNAESEITNPAHPVPLDSLNIKGKVSFEHVWLKYEKNTPEWKLAEINFTALPGQLIALVGPTGAGKTSIAHLIPRLFDPDIGSVSIDDVNVSKFNLSDLQKLIAVVTQEAFFFHASISQNLLVGNPNATLQQVVDACKAASIHDTIQSLPDGYNTIVGERGFKLSGGEKQRLSIARAILKDPKILILDEATSALDTESEKLIQSTLNSLMQNRTTFAIAHRLSTIQNADIIIVVENGRIVESGTHTELLKAGERYSKLHCNIYQPFENTQ